LSDPDDYIVALALNRFLAPPLAAINDYQRVGYQWVRRHWGNKGTFDVTWEWHSTKQIQYLFSTGNTEVSDEVMVEMSVAFPGLVFEYEWDEPGCRFEGRLVAQGGAITEKDEAADTNYTGRLYGPPEDEDKETPV
jgi:hypothetical protein